MSEYPATILAATIWIYWLWVGVMMVRIYRRTGKLSGIVPEQRIERFMWVIWVPVIAAWMTIPYLATTSGQSPWALPNFATQPGYLTVRWIAVIVAVACFALTVECWLRMGRSWRIAVTTRQKTDLVATGLYGYVRHPIYALSILLMFCSVLIVPTVPMGLIGTVHVVLMLIKAAVEERFLRATLGDAYERYCRQTGRFLPRFSMRRSRLVGSP